MVIGEERLLEILKAVMKDDKELLGEMTEKEEQAYEEMKQEYEEKKDKGYAFDISYDC